MSSFLGPEGWRRRIKLSAYLSVSERGIPRWKRCLDTGLALLSLILLLPTVVAICVWIKVVSRGPILYRQERVGYRGARFTLYKFRTMRENVQTVNHERHTKQLMHSERPMIKLDQDDSRLIPGSRVLRSLGLDELPQIINVIRGEMSLVGPRPCTPSEFEGYGDADKERCSVLPGLTGYWQVRGKNKTTFKEMIALDIHYTRNVSVWMDLLILAKTVPAMVGHAIEDWVISRSRKVREFARNHTGTQALRHATQALRTHTGTQALRDATRALRTHTGTQALRNATRALRNHTGTQRAENPDRLPHSGRSGA